MGRKSNGDLRIHHAGRRISPPRRPEVHGAAVQAAGQGAVPGDHRGARRRLVQRRSERVPDLRRRLRTRRPGGGGDRLPPCRRRLSDVARRHQLCDPLGEGERVGTEHARRPGRHRRTVERRASRHAGGDAAERSALCGDPVAVIGTGGGCDGARGGDAVAGDQSAVALSPCVAGARFGQSAGLGRQHSAAA